MTPRVAAFDAWMARQPLAYASLVAVAACLVLALFVDLPLLVHLQSESWQSLRPIFRLIGNLGKVEGYVAIATGLYIACLVAAGRQSRESLAAWYRWVARHCLLYFAGLLASSAAIHLLKLGIARLRPRGFLEDSGYGLGSPFAGFPWDSFPSGHTQVAFATAAVLALLAPRWAPVVYLLAALVGIARLVTGWHYLSDIVASAFISMAAVKLLARVLLDPARDWPGRAPLAWFRRRSPA
ncbi:MAG TPA: phosphatase PAP2 family protein [Kiloniellales bacterium]|nr:phosphatase PAP2 family protein [Kiloniellales bacterium]